MDKDKLERLRARYADAPAGRIYDERLAHASKQMFTEAGDRHKPYSGVATFLDLPFRDGLTGLDGLDVAAIGVPMDLGVSNRAGARLGPRAIRAVERIGPYNYQTDLVPAGRVAAADVGDAPTARFSLPDSMRLIEEFYHKIIDAGVSPLSAGGDHSITYPILKAVGRDAPVGLLHIDAHCDTGGEFDGSKFNHGGPFRLAVLDGVLDPERTIQIGIRGAAEILWEFSYESGMTVIHIEDFMEMGVAGVIEKAKQVLGDQPFYVSIDVDGFDPAYAPGTGTPEVGGLTPREGQQILRGLTGMKVVGGDVVEVAPQYDATTVTAQLGAQMMFEIFCLLAAAKSDT